MKNVKIPTSVSYDKFLIERLKNPEHAAGFIEAILSEENSEPELLCNALKKVIEAYGSHKNSSESDQEYSKKLDKILTTINSQEIYNFISLLNSLGFQVEIKVKK